MRDRKWITIPISILIGCIIIAAVIGYQIKQMSTNITGAIADAQISISSAANTSSVESALNNLISALEANK